MTDKISKSKKTSDVSSIREPKILNEDPILKDYLNETLKLEGVRQKKKRGKSISGVDERSIKNNNDRKVNVLNKHLFGSMANLIYFFRYLNKHPELIDRFGDDIDELLGLKIDDKKSPVTIQSQSFRMLINAILSYPQIRRSEYTDDERFNFKRRLLPIIQEHVFRMMERILVNRRRDGKEHLFNLMVNNDFQRANTWTQYVDRPTPHQNKTIARKILVSDIEPGEEDDF